MIPLSAIVAHAPPGSTVIVRGVQHGDVVIDRPLTLRGENGAQITGGTSGIIVRAPHVTIENLTVRGYGLSDAGGNQGAIVLSQAPYAHIVRNTIRDCTADSIRLWYSPNAVIEGNLIRSGRDVFITYSPGVTFRNNTVTLSRYGLHDMFSDRMTVAGNTFQENEIGANFMYGRGLVVRGNAFIDNHGATGYGMGLEDVDDSRIENNRIAGNHVGLNAVDSPSDPSLPDRVAANIFAHNGSAIVVQSNPHALRVLGNAFVDNLEDVQVSGGGTAQGVMWSAGARGNYWSAYAGYDRNGDGVGEVPYEPRASFDSITDAHPEMQMFRYSPATMAMEFAARALPATASSPKLADAAPLMNMPAGAGVTVQRKPNGLAALLALLSVVPLAAGRRFARKRAHAEARMQQRPRGIAIEATGVTRRYTGGRGLSGLDVYVQNGESVALWGPNGAGKTTFFRCVLGERLDSGSLRVFGAVPDPNEPEARRNVGYAPQHLPDFDARVGEIAQLVAAVREAGDDAASRALAQLHLTDSRDRFIGELSGGMRQRLSIALALIGDPPLLLLDEPTAGLDSESRRIVLHLLAEERKRGKTLLITSHLQEDVNLLADRVIVIEDGRCIEERQVS
jgi:nitrous oxidase accessory protein